MTKDEAEVFAALKLSIEALSVLKPNARGNT